MRSSKSIEQQRFAVIGMGRFGRQLAVSLSERGAEVVAVDLDMHQVDLVVNEVTHAVQLNSVDEDALRAQGIDKVDVAIVAIGENFESNVLTTALLKRLGVRRVIARASSEIQRQILELIGADRVVFPEAESGVRLAQSLLVPDIWRYIPLSGDRVVAELAAPKRFWGKSIGTLKIRNRFGINIIAIKRTRTVDGPHGPVTEEVIDEMPNPDYVIDEQDTLIVVGRGEDIEQLSAQ